MKKAVFFDGNSLIYRGFYALQASNLTSPEGIQTGAIHGFFSSLSIVLNDIKPDFIGVAFDTPDETFRHVLSDDYKSTRPETPQELIDQISLCKNILNALNITVVEKAGYEADDILGTLATKFSALDHEVYIATGDRDLFQLIKDPLIKVLYFSAPKPKFEVFQEEDVFKKVGVYPKDYALYLAIKGDASDNIKGIKGVGEKTAREIVNNYDTIEKIYNNLPQFKPNIQKGFNESRDNLERDLVLATIKRDVSLENPADEFSVEKINLNNGLKIFKDLGMAQSPKRLAEALSYVATNSHKLESDYQIRLNIDFSLSLKLIEVSEFLEKLSRSKIENDSILSLPIGDWREFKSVGFSSADKENDKLFWVCTASFEDDRQQIAEILTRYKVDTFRGKDLIAGFLSNSFKEPNINFDVELAGSLFSPSYHKASLELMVNDFCATPYEKFADEIKVINFDGSIQRGFAEKLVATYNLKESLNEALKKEAMRDLYNNLEKPVTSILAKMELQGVSVDEKTLREFSQEIVNKESDIKEEIFNLLGLRFNLNSSRQLQEILYDQLSLSKGRKIKTGYSTNAKSLEKLRDLHPVIDKVLKYRELEKLRSTYGESLIEAIGPDGKIHARFLQNGSRTGRITSENPNMQNIPRKTEEGGQIRKAICASPKSCLIVADYDQIELRILAHLSSDANLIEVLSSERDVHKEVASKIFGVPISGVTDNMRQQAKMVSYGLIYGMEAFGLSERLNIDRADAELILKNYFREFPSVKHYMEVAVEKAKQDGFSVTLFGRRRRLPELNSQNPRIRKSAERAAINLPAQGLASDIFKLALVKINEFIMENKLSSKIVLQIHDEVIVDAPEEEAQLMMGSLENLMASVVSLKVPLLVHIKKADNWFDAKS